MRFLSQLLREGPELSQCLRLKGTSVDAILPVILPTGLKKNVLSKALQSRNGIIVSEALKGLHCVLQRLASAKQPLWDAAPTDGASDNIWERLAAKVTTALPDIQVVLSTLSRFDLDGDDRASPIVCGYLAQTLQSYASTLPTVLQTVKFDWIKLLPSTAASFRRLSLILQLRLLRTLERLLKLTNVSCTDPALACSV